MSNKARKIETCENLNALVAVSSRAMHCSLPFAVNYRVEDMSLGPKARAGRGARGACTHQPLCHPSSVSSLTRLSTLTTLLYFQRSRSNHQLRLLSFLGLTTTPKVPPYCYHAPHLIISNTKIYSQVEKNATTRYACVYPSSGGNDRG